MTTPPFSGNDFRDQIDSVARNLTGNAFRLKQNDPDAPLKFMDFVAQSENEFMQVQQPMSELEMLNAQAEARIADPQEQLAPFSPDVGQTPASPDSPLVRALTPTRPLIDRDVAERAGRGLPLVGDVTGPVFGAASELTSPLEAALIAASAGLGAPLAGAARGIPAVGRFIAPLLEPVSGGFGRAAAAEAAAGTGAILGSEQAAEALQDAPAPIRTAGTIIAGLAGGGVGFAAPSAARRTARAAGDVATAAGAAAERAGIPSPVSVADAAFDDVPFELPRELSRSRVNFGQRSIEFTDDFDRAVYIATSRNPSKRRKQFEDIVRSELDRRGLPSDDLTATAAPLRERVRQIAASSSGDEIIVPRGIQSDTGRASFAPTQSILPEGFGTAPEGTTITTPEGTRTFDPQGVEIVEATARAADDVPDVARRRSVGDIENEIDEVDNALKIARKEVDDWTPTRERVDAGEGVLGKRFVELHPDDKSDIARLEAVRDDLQARRKNLTDELNDAFEQATPVTPARAADDAGKFTSSADAQKAIDSFEDELVEQFGQDELFKAEVPQLGQSVIPEEQVRRLNALFGERDALIARERSGEFGEALGRLSSETLAPSSTPLEPKANFDDVRRVLANIQESISLSEATGTPRFTSGDEIVERIFGDLTQRMVARGDLPEQFRGVTRQEAQRLFESGQFGVSANRLIEQSDRIATEVLGVTRAADDVPPRLPEQAIQPPVARQADEVARLTPEQQLEADVAAARQAPPPEPPVARPITTAGGAPRQPRVPDTGRQGVLLEVPPTEIGENLLDLRPIQIRELGVVDRALNSARATLGKLTNKEVVLKNKLVKAAFDEVRRVQPRITSQANLKTASISEAARVFVRDSKGRIPALAGIDPAVPGAPTIQDVAARRPRYLAYLSEEQKAALERIRFEMDDYVKARDEVGLEVSGRGDLVGAATPTESGFYLPRGGNPDSPDVPRSTRGRGGKIGAEQRAVYDSMAQAMDDGATYFPFGDAIQGFGQNMGERLANMHAANFLRRLEVETGIPLGRAGGKPLPGELGLPSGSAVPSLRELRGTTFPPEITNAVNEILATQGELIGKGSEVLKAINAYNNFYRGSRSTLDNSAIMIQGLLGSASDPQASARAMLLNTEIWKTGKAREIFGRYVADADKQADDVLGIPDFSRSAAQKGLILNGGETELTQSVITRIPGVRRAGNAFGFYGDALRLSWLADEVAIEMRRTGKTGQQIVQDGTLERLAKAINPATGVTEGNRLTDIASIASFAPRFLQSRLLTVARGIRGLDVDAPLDILPSSVRSRVPLPATPLNRAARLEDRIARKALIRLIGYGTAITVGANAAQGEETDFRLFVNGRLNPNFMRIRFGERDFSVFGTWDSIAKLIIGTGQGISQGNVKTILGSARGLGSGITTQAWDLLSGRDFEGRETRTNPQKFAAHITRSHLPFQAEELPAASGKIVEGVREGDIGQAATGVAQIALEGHGAKSSPLSGGDQLDIATKEGNFSSDSFGDLEPFERNEVRDQVGDVFRDRGTPQDIFFDGIDQIEHREPGTLGVSDVGGREPRRERLLAQASTLSKGEIIDEWFSIESDAAAERNGLRLGTGVEFDPEQDDREKLLEGWYAIFGIPSVRDKLGRARFTELDKQRKSFLAELSPKQREFLLRNTHLRPVDPQMLVILKNAGAQGTVKNIQDSEIARERFRVNLQNSDIGDGSPVAPVQPRFPQAPNFGIQPVLPLGDR